MDKRTIQSMTLTERRQAYDAHCKVILSRKEVLSRILKTCTTEFRDCTLQDIEEKYIEGMPEIGETPVLPGSYGHIRGDNTEDVIPQEQTIRYDIRFRAAAPDNSGSIGLIINVEAQTKFNQTYPLIKRGIYYCARLLSAQYGVEFEKSHYENLKKVYSIWLCTNPPKYRQNTIVKYHMTEEALEGAVSEPETNYDLLQVIMVCLGKDTETEQEMLDFLDTMFSQEMTEREIREKLAKNHGFSMTEEWKEDIETMCNLSEGVYERGLQQGMQQGMQQGAAQQMLELVRRMTADGAYTLEAAAKILHLTEEEYAFCKKELEPVS